MLCSFHQSHKTNRLSFLVWVFLFHLVLHSSAKALTRDDSHFKEALEFDLAKNFGPRK